jgi:uncharacterized membrane protein YesL
MKINLWVKLYRFADAGLVFATVLSVISLLGLWPLALVAFSISLISFVLVMLSMSRIEAARRRGDGQG